MRRFPGMEALDRRTGVITASPGGGPRYYYLRSLDYQVAGGAVRDYRSPVGAFIQFRHKDEQLTLRSLLNMIEGVKGGPVRWPGVFLTRPVLRSFGWDHYAFWVSIESLRQFELFIDTLASVARVQDWMVRPTFDPSKLTVADTRTTRVRAAPEVSFAIASVFRCRTHAGDRVLRSIKMDAEAAAWTASPVRASLQRCTGKADYEMLLNCCVPDDHIGMAIALKAYQSVTKRVGVELGAYDISSRLLLPNVTRLEL